MAVRLVERPGVEFQPRPAVAPHVPRQWLTQPTPPLAAPTVSRYLTQAGVLAAIAATIVMVAVYLAGRAPNTPVKDVAPLRLAVAALIGIAISAVHMRLRGSRAVGLSLARAQILLCVAGAMTMILIDNSVARAFGIAGAASIVRFRTPVEDPTDATVLFLLMALGMASGVGAFGVAVAGAGGVCLLLAAFTMFGSDPHRRQVTIELVGSGRDFPTADVHRVFARHGIAIEPAEWSQDTSTRVKYRALVDETLPLEEIGAELMDRSEGALASVAWEVRKKAAGE